MIISHIRRHIIGYVALLVALGGTSWAASQVDSGDVANNSLRSADLKNRKAVKGKDVIPNSIPGSAITDASLLGSDIAADSVTGQNVAEASLGIVPNSERVNGSRVRYVSATVPENSVQQVASAGGLGLILNCNAAAAALDASGVTGAVPISTASLNDNDNSGATPAVAVAFDATAPGPGASLSLTGGAASSAGTVRAGTGPGSALFQFAFKQASPCDFDALVAESP